MEIVGKPLVSNAIRDLEVGKSGWVAPINFLYFYKSDGNYLLYCNLECAYVSEKEGEFTFQVTKNSDQKDGYRFDLDQLAMSFQPNVNPPSNISAYTNPYDLGQEVEVYTLVGSYARLSVGELNSYLEDAQVSVHNDDGIYAPHELEAILDALIIKSQLEWENKNPLELADQIVSINTTIQNTDEQEKKPVDEDSEFIIKTLAWKHMRKSLKKRVRLLRAEVAKKLRTSSAQIKSEFYFKFEDYDDLCQLLQNT